MITLALEMPIGGDITTDQMTNTTPEMSEDLIAKLRSGDSSVVSSCTARESTQSLTGL